MRFLVTLLTTAVLATASPALPFIWTPSPSSLQTCTSATFTTLNTLPPASWRDCAALYSSWASINGSFTIYPSSTTNNDTSDTTNNHDTTSFIPILKADACTLAVKPGTVSYFVGDEDVGAILKEVLVGFSSGGLVAAKGGVVCDAVGGEGELEWQLFDSGS